MTGSSLDCARPNIVFGLDRAPIATAGVVALTVAVNLAQAADPALLGRLERTPAGLHGEWWRTLTSLLVQDGGIAGALSNLIFLAALGVVAEQVLPRWRWLAQYVVVGVLAELVGYAWQPVGGGNSIAVCGLAGGVAVASWREDLRLPAFAPAALLLWCAAVISTISGSVFVPALAVGIAGSAWTSRRVAAGKAAGRLPAAVVLASGIALVVATNIHGAALLFGLALALGPGALQGR